MAFQAGIAFQPELGAESGEFFGSFGHQRRTAFAVCRFPSSHQGERHQ